MSIRIEAVFFDPNRQREDIFNFYLKGLDLSLAADLRDCFIECTGHYAARSRYQAWRSTRMLIRHIIKLKLSSTSKYQELLAGFADELIKSPRLRKTNGSHYNFCRRMLVWLNETSESEFWIKQKLPFFLFGREAFNTRDNDISPEVLKSIVEACKKEISEVRTQIGVRKKILSGEEVDHNVLNLNDIARVSESLEFEARDIWTRTDFLKARKYNADDLGLRRLKKFKESTMAGMLPIYLLLMVTVAANPVALMEIKVECIEPDPTDDTRVFFCWDKPRSASEQRISVLKIGKFSIGSLVALVAEMTEPIRHLASRGEESILFILRTGRTSSRMNVQSLHNTLKEFRARHNLPYFTFSDLRKAIAGELFAKSSRNSVTHFLQHKNSSTSEGYLKSDRVLQERYERLTKFQGEMIALAEFSEPIPVKESYTTVFGFTCKSPISGTAPRSRKGEPCLEFIACANCPNAVVIKDDPFFIARILKAQECLQKLEKKSYGSSDDTLRFDTVLKPVLEIIDKEILSNVPKDVKEKAMLIMGKIPNLPLVY